MDCKNNSVSSGFTIVELLVVIVVIGILAAITITAYTGINNKAVAASLQSDLVNASRQLKLDQVENSDYPATLSDANGGKGIPASSGTTYQYTVDNTTSPQSFCITATNGGQSYKVTNDSTPVAGVCTDYGKVLDLDAGKPSSYPGSGTNWSDLSGNGNNGTLINGVGYTPDVGGALTFNGLNNYASVVSSSSLNPGSGEYTVSVWFRMDSVGSINGSILYNKENLYEASAGGGWFSYAWQPYWAWVNGFPVSVGQWYNGVVVYDKTKQYVYENGLLVSSRSQTGNIGSNTVALGVGARGLPGASAFLQGSVGNIQAYNRALSASEIQQIFNNFHSRYGI